MLSLVWFFLGESVSLVQITPTSPQTEAAAACVERLRSIISRTPCISLSKAAAGLFFLVILMLLAGSKTCGMISEIWQFFFHSQRRAGYWSWDHLFWKQILKVVKSAVFSYFYPSFTTFGIRTPFLRFERFIFVSWGHCLGSTITSFRVFWKAKGKLKEIMPYNVTMDCST